MTDKELMEGVKQGKIDFFFSNPAIYAEMNKQFNAQAVATMLKLSKTNPTEYVAGSIFVRNDSPVKTLADFKGKEFITRAQSSFAGWMVAKRHFLEKGIDPEKDFKKIRDAQSMEHVVYAVLNGVVAGGAVMAGTLEEMAQEGKIKMADFRVIDQVADNFPFAHTTQLYPEFAIAAGAHVPATLKSDVSQALLSMAPSDPAAVDAKVSGWKKPLDYAPVVDCLTILKYGSFAKN
jgi:ABC-type phosphate/phosphonate transport system substrate-binding protein